MERIPRYPEPDGIRWHKPVGRVDPEGTSVPIACGGIIAFPSRIEDRPAVEVCPDCRRNR
jgi:hypothetical protein